MPSLFKQHNRYYLQFYDSARQPKRKRIALGVARKREAKKLERRLVSAYAEGEFDPWTDDPRTFAAKGHSPPTLSKAKERFLDIKREQGRATRTIQNYNGFLSRLIRCIGDRQIDALRVDVLNEWIRDDDVTDTTQRSRHRYVSAFLNVCVREGWIDQNPLASERAPGKGSRLPKTMYREDLDAISEAIQNDYEEKLESDLCDEGEVIWRERVFRFAFLTGLRGSEIARLKWKHIDRDRGLIYILKQKNGKQQTIPLHRKAADVLKNVPKGDPETYVFGGPGTRGGERSIEAFRNNLSRAFRKYKEEAGIERPITLHSLRHGFCTALAEAGKSAATIKELARHASIETSMIYVKMSNEHLREEMNDVFQS